MKALAERYAGALVDVALENKQADLVKQELAAFAAMVRESPDLHSFLSNPSIARAIKHAAIEQLVARMGASRTLRNYLFVIVDQRRAGMLIEIEQAFSASAGRAAGNHAGHGDFGGGIDGRGARGTGRRAGETDRARKCRRNSRRMRR